MKSGIYIYLIYIQQKAQNDYFNKRGFIFIIIIDKFI